MTRSVIDPITRIEGHLRAEMEVTDGVVTDAWISGGCFRGMELVVRDRTPEDAAYIVQRICGVCPVSHMHSASIAAEQALGITIPNNARIIRNLIEGAQFLHSHILWLYNLAGLDYVNPLNALGADAADAYDLAAELGTPSADFVGLQDRLKKFADNGQLSIFSGNWFDTGEYNMTPEADLILTAHYLEALQMQSKASEIAALLGGKMPHIMTIVPGGTAFVPTAEKLDDLKGLVDEVYQWVADTMIPDTLAIAKFYPEATTFGKGIGRYAAWGVFESRSTRALPTLIACATAICLLAFSTRTSTSPTPTSRRSPSTLATLGTRATPTCRRSSRTPSPHLLSTMSTIATLGTSARSTMASLSRPARSLVCSSLISVAFRSSSSTSTRCSWPWALRLATFLFCRIRSVVRLPARLRPSISLP